MIQVHEFVFSLNVINYDQFVTKAVLYIIKISDFLQHECKVGREIQWKFLKRTYLLFLFYCTTIWLVS